MASAYGWPATAATDPYEVVPRLMALNREIAAGQRPYRPFPSRDTAAEEPALFRVEA